MQNSLSDSTSSFPHSDSSKLRSSLYPDDEGKKFPFVFTGSGGEYFRIWIVNLFLTIITFGIYSAWAKVRRLKYIYQHTEINGSSFDYHGRPIAILKGRIIALILFGAYNIAFEVSPTAGMIAFIIFALVIPALLWSSFRFRLHNTSYRGVRFGFHGRISGAYKTFLGIPLLATVSLIIAISVLLMLFIGSSAIENIQDVWKLDQQETTTQTYDLDSGDTDADEYDDTDTEEEDENGDTLFEYDHDEEIDEDDEAETDAIPFDDANSAEDEMPQAEETPDKKSARDLADSWTQQIISILIPGLIGTLLFLFMICLYYAVLHFYTKRYQHGNSHFGTASFGFYAELRTFFKIYVLTALIWIGSMVVIGIIGALLFPLLNRLLNKEVLAIFTPLFVIYLPLLVIVLPFWMSMIQNVIWNNTQLEQHQFSSQVPLLKVIWVILTNLFATIITLGLFHPFAHIRLLKVRVAAVSLISAGSIETFMSATEADVTATGEGVADFLDFDIGL